MLVEMLGAVVVGLEAVVLGLPIDPGRARSSGTVVKPKGRRRENTDLSFVVDYVFDKAQYTVLAWLETDMGTGSNLSVVTADLAVETFDCSLKAGKEDADGSVDRPCQLRHRGALLTAQWYGAFQVVVAR